MLIERSLGRVRAIWTDRHGGVSEPPYDTLDLTTANGDVAAAVTENRRRLAAALGLSPPGEWWWLRQVHGARVVDADGPPPPEPPAADAVVTTSPDTPLVVLTADCAPIALAADGVGAAVHAGWPGLLAGVVESAVARVRALGRGPVRAVLGPCVHPEHYEFGRADLDRVVAALGPEVESVTADGAPALDIPRAVARALERAGVDEVEDVGVCTAASPDHFSHRRDGTTGRQALVVVVSPR